jgi:hypothetical protein
MGRRQRPGRDDHGRSSLADRGGYSGCMWWRREKTEVSEFLYRLLVADAPSKGFARQVADRMGVPYPTLSKYWLGKTRFPAALVGPLFLATDQDVRVAEFFLLKGSAYRLERDESAPPTGDLIKTVVTISDLAGQISGLYLKATDPRSEDGPAISDAEATSLAEATRALIRAAEKLRAALPVAARKRG